MLNLITNTISKNVVIKNITKCVFLHFFVLSACFSSTEVSEIADNYSLVKPSTGKEKQCTCKKKYSSSKRNISRSHSCSDLEQTTQGQIYLDYQATTPCDPRVKEIMQPYFCENFGNPHSNHPHGWDAEKAVNWGREEVAKLINADPSEIIFTSGASEANNLAIKGAAKECKKSGKNHIITSEIEHKCVLNACKALEQEGFNVTYLPVDNQGLINLDQLRQAITDKTCIVSIMTVNNEIGVIQPIKEIGDICKQSNVLFHTDAAQAFGKIPLDVKNTNIDLMSISSHKIYGPKGIGALYVKNGVNIVPIIDGGGQEKGLRAGTLPVPLCVGFGEACKIARVGNLGYIKKISELTMLLYNKVKEALGDNVSLNGSLEHRVPGNLNLRFKDINRKKFLEGIKNLSISFGSACNASSQKPSHVLSAIGFTPDDSNFSIRIGIGKPTTENEIEMASNEIITAANNAKIVNTKIDTNTENEKMATKDNKELTSNNEGKNDRMKMIN